MIATSPQAAADADGRAPTRTPRRRRAGLSPARRRLAERYVALARSLARPFKKAYPRAWEEFDSAALYALVEAAEAFDPRRSVRFATYARFRILGALCDAKRRANGEARMQHAAGPPPPIPNDRRVLGIAPEPPVGEGLERSELLESWLRRLPPRHAAACRQLYLLGRNQVEAAHALGLSQSRLSCLHRDALLLLGSQLRPPGSGPA